MDNSTDERLDAEIDQFAKALKRPQRSRGSTADVLPPETPHFNDLANADRFLQFAGDDLLYCAEAGKWLIWQGTHWAFDNKDFVFSLAADFTRGMYQNIRFGKDEIINAKRANDQAGFNAILKFAARARTASINTFDTDPYIINCKNGTLDLRTGALRPHNRNDRLTKIVAADYDPEFESPNFNKFLTDIQPDPSVRAFLQRSIGYSLLGVVRERAFWILYGTGNNGKSVFIDTFSALLGEYASSAASASIMAVKSPSSIPNDIARLKGKRFVIVSETEENERINASLIKALSAGDTVTARFLFGEFFDFAFSAKLWIATNHRPTITDHSKGFWDRIKVIPFATDIAADKVIKKDTLMRRLLAEAPALLAWAVQGCRDYFELDGLDTPDAIRADIENYKYEQDSIAQFIAERCQTIERAKEILPDREFLPIEFRVANGDLYRAYKKFCDDNGEYLRSHRRFSQNLRERGFRQLKSGERYWDGLRLIGET